MPRCVHCDQEHAEGAHFCPVTGRPFGNVAERMIGRTLGGKYRLERAIGQGGMGTIFEATHTAIGSKVAVKLLHEAFAEKREPVQRLYREARATGAIGHPSIIKVFDVGETSDGIPFLVMELLEGESLGDHVESHGPRPLGFVLDVGIQMLSALQAAHEAGIIHRDLKSDNVFLLAGAGDGVSLKILDFGISKFTTPDGENLRLTQTGSVLGTPYYMAPEQARGVKDLDRRLDIYAAGVILYELLLGTIPRRSSNYNALLIEIITEDVSPFRHIRTDVPERLEAAVLRALARNRDLRWPDAKSLMGELQAIREHTPAHVLQGESPPVDRAGALRWTHNSETLDFGSLSSREPIPETRLAFETGGKRRRALLLGALGIVLAAVAILAWLFAAGGDETPQSQPVVGGPAPIPDAATTPAAEPPPEPATQGPADAGLPDAGPVEEQIGARGRPGAGEGGKSEKSVKEAKDAKNAKESPGKGDTAHPAAVGPRASPKDGPSLDRPMDNPF